MEKENNLNEKKPSKRCNTCGLSMGLGVGGCDCVCLCHYCWRENKECYKLRNYPWICSRMSGIIWLIN